MAELRTTLRLARPDEISALVRIDDAASELFAEAGLVFALAADHPFVRAEVQRWARAIEAELAYVAVDADDQPLGFITLALVDDAPYLDQLAVLPRAMRRGIGTALTRQALAWSGAAPLWLTTYAHVAWNAPYYRRFGFVTVADADCGPELRRVLASQRAALPDPAQRIAMVRRS